MVKSNPAQKYSTTIPPIIKSAAAMKMLYIFFHVFIYRISTARKNVKIIFKGHIPKALEEL